jgi:2-succinyl-6-hydroxy-2,4-cyclohexadiene-1-carboxylate synthase
VTPLVLVHGFAGSPESFCDVERQLGAERLGLRIFRPALLGHAPGNLEGPRRFEQEVDRLAVALVQAGARAGHLCGYSLGARVALGLLARHAHLFRSATLISVHPGLATTLERRERAGQDERWCRLLSHGDVGAFAQAWEAQPLFATRACLPESRRSAHRRIRMAHSCSGLSRALRVLGLAQMPSYRGALLGLRLPVRLLVGALDPKFLAIGRALTENNRGLRLEIVEGAGHDLLAEAPERVASVLTRALES